MIVAESSCFEETGARLGSREEGCQRTYGQLGTAEVRQYGEDGSQYGKQQEEFL